MSLLLEITLETLPSLLYTADGIDNLIVIRKLYDVRFHKCSYFVCVF